MAKKTVPLSRALIWIFLSTVLVSGSATLAWLYALRLEAKRVRDPLYNITHLFVSSEGELELNADYFAELLGLSVDHMSNIYRFDPKRAELLLRRSPLIRTAKVKKRLPHTVAIHYESRKPRAVLLDWSNTAIDADGKLFPLAPFFADQQLPELYLGIAQCETMPWGSRLEGDQFRLALELLDCLDEEKQRELGELKRLDVSEAYSDSLGKRQVVLEMDDSMGYHLLLRLNSADPKQSLAHYEELRPYLHNFLRDTEEGVVDLRVPGFGYVSA